MVEDIEREVTVHTSGQHQLEQCMDRASSWRMEGIEGIMAPTDALQRYNYNYIIIIYKRVMNIVNVYLPV